MNFVKKSSLVLVCFLMSAGLIFAQNKQVTGLVKDNTGELVVGASVVVKGTTIGVLTDSEGKFSLDVPETATVIVVSYIGFEAKEVDVAPYLEIILEPDVSALDEVVVVAYGTQRRSTIVGAVKSVDGDKIAAISTSNVTNALQGAAAGVQVVNGSGQPGTGATIRIRGVGSISGGTTPLYIVDGAPYDGSVMNLLNPHDIESMSVLKDASATAIYGARGANGVVLITTKSGEGTGKISVNLESKWGNSRRGVPNYNVMTDPAMYYETAYLALYNSQIYSGKSAATAYAYADANFLTQTGVGYQIYTVPAGERIIGTNFKLNPNATLGYKDEDYYYTPDNWEKETLKTDNLRQEYNLSVQGGGKQAQFFVSLGYLDDPGLIDGSGFERYTLRGRIDSQAKKWMKIGLSASYANSNYQNPGYQTSWGSSGNVFSNANRMAPIYPFYVRNADGSLKKDSRGYQIYDAGTSTNFVRPGSAPRGNHAINLLLDSNKAITDHFNGNVYLTLTPVEGLSLTARISPEAANIRSNSLSNPFYGSTGSQGYVAVGHDRLFTLNQQYLANYKKTFAGKHKVEALAGYESFSLTKQDLSASNDHLYNPFIGELNNAFGTQPVSSQALSSSEHFATEGYFGRLQYDLLDRYFLNATIRYEGSSRFAPDKRWGTFASIGAGWLISNESFLDGTKDWLDELKYKISYGTQGNDQIRNYYAFRDLYSISYNSDTGEYTKVLYLKGNPELTWEAQKLFNTGIEFSVFDGKLSGEIDYFSRLNSDMLFNVPMPPSAGYSSEPQNIGSVFNNGIEIELNAEIFKTNDIKWTVFANATNINSKIRKLPDNYKPTEADPVGGIKGSTSILKEGGSLNQLYTVEYAGVDEATGEALYYIDPTNGDRNTTATYADAKQTDLGDISVKWYGGFGTSLEVYGFDFGLHFAYQLGGKAYDGTYQELMHTGKEMGRNWHKDILNAWTPENKNTDVPRINTTDDHDQTSSSRWIVSSNYLSLNNLTLGYTLPSKVTRKLQIDKFRIYVSGDNLALFTARKGYDPRQSQNANATGVAISTSSGNYVYSLMKVVSGGISITF
ncbi:MAG: TonB-dependent receptor [Prevotellaceae bacterium]|jgi:TonB-linked SusC/RagA family outer membrane protein|nr:TonB-dependent receptor [Prevotellaceae bacterium]